MGLNQLRSLIEVAQAESFTVAAENLNLTQPSVSLQIKKLEEELGQKLVNRGHRKSTLTPAGIIVYTHALQVFFHLNTLRTTFLDLDKKLDPDVTS